MTTSMGVHSLSLIALLIAWVSNCTSSTDRWPDHDISTLKLLTIMLRHGDRAPINFPPNDPFASEKYWPSGIGELLPIGKYRLFKRGQFIREEYDPFLSHNPREVYVRSALTDRCLESVACLLSGAYPVKNEDWKWNNGTDAELGMHWQPFPIYTFMPNHEDLVLEQNKPCPAAERATKHIHNRCQVKTFFEENKQLIEELKNITGKTDIDTFYGSGDLQNTLAIETNMDYIWDKVWTREQQEMIVKKLGPVNDLYWNYEWDSPVIKRLRGGGFVKEMRQNFQDMIDGKIDKKKFYVYSTHDSHIGLILCALDMFNHLAPPYAATILWELHKKDGTGNDVKDWFVKAYYHNETDINSHIPYLMEWTDCSHKTECPVNEFFESTQHLVYEDFDKECNQ